MNPVIIVGTGLAGYTLAREFRKLDTTTPVMMFTRDGGEFYSKPMLSNALAHDMSPGRLASADAARMAEQLNAVIRTGTEVAAIDAAGRSIEVDGARIPYSRLVLAVGARQIVLSAEGDASDTVFMVNSLDDYARYRAAVARAERVAVIGPGLIGCEFADDLRSAGKRVTVVGPDSTPLGRLLPPRAGAAFRAALEDAGVAWRLGTTVRSITRQGGAWAIALADDSILEADLVLSSIGLRPDTVLASAAGLAVRRGIVVDRCLRTSAADVYALGDCAEVEGRVLPFVMPIMHGARALARTLCGEPTPVSYPAMPVLVKTPSCPVVVSPAPADAAGEWREEAVEGGVRARFIAPDGALLGFALTGAAVAEKQSLTAQLPPVLA
ncbi:MAG: FAD-dependent oxidoreductase [Gammaproteobacteria bacterium]|nr:FAD-dependent oxidoreductase [Gammaproteobacteria bacterium]